MLEIAIEERVQKFAEQRGWLVRKLQWIGRTGAPDRLYMRRGRFVFTEFKQAGKRPDPKQSREHGRLRAAGAEVVVIDTVEKGVEFFA